MKDSDLEIILKNLKSIGCAYGNRLPAVPADPERTILNSLQLFWSAPDVFNMMMGVLTYKIHDLIHVDRLVSLAGELYGKEKILLKIIGLKMEVIGDRRYKILQAKLPTGRASLDDIPEDYFDPYLIEKYGLDNFFLKYRIEIFDRPLPDKKKFFTRKHILEHNPWLKLRALIGSNYKADITYLKAAKIASTPVEAIAIAGCSRPVAYVHWKLISQIKDIYSLVS